VLSNIFQAIGDHNSI